MWGSNYITSKCPTAGLPRNPVEYPSVQVPFDIVDRFFGNHSFLQNLLHIPRFADSKRGLNRGPAKMVTMIGVACSGMGQNSNCLMFLLLK